METFSNNSAQPFIVAPEWNQERALAKADFLELAEKNIALLEHRYGRTKALKRFLDSFNRGSIGEDIREKLRIKNVSLRVYYKWTKAFKDKGLDGLLEKYTNGGIKIDREVLYKIEGLIWKNHLARYKDIHDDLSLLIPKDKIPSYHTLRNYAKTYKEDKWAELVLKHEGVRGLRDRNMSVVLGRMDENLTEPNQRWEIDTTIADIFTERKIKDVRIETVDGKRCKLIGIIDVFSRMVRFFLTDRETGFMAGLAIRDRILAWGVPELIVIDNGRPYKNRRVLSFLRGIGTAVHICIPGNPVEKPHIERVFRTLSESLFRRADGYSGNSVSNKPKVIKVTYTMQELQKEIDDWTCFIYAERTHSSTGQRPRERMSPPGFVPKTIAERHLDILLMEPGERKVNQGHISYMGGKYFHPKLPEGQRVSFRINDFDSSELVVYFKGKYICTAEDITRKGLTPSQIREMKKARNNELRIRIKAHESILNKLEENKTGIINYIRQKEKEAPALLPKKAEVLPFPSLDDITYSKPEIAGTETIEDLANLSDYPQDSLFKTKRERYLNIMTRKTAGERLDDLDIEFLENFHQSNEFRLIGSYLDNQLQGSAASER